MKQCSPEWLAGGFAAYGVPGFAIRIQEGNNRKKLINFLDVLF
jgi:hypothetical protein